MNDPAQTGWPYTDGVTQHAPNSNLGLDPAELWSSDLPPEWDEVPPELLARLVPQATRTIPFTLPNGQVELRQWNFTGVLTKEQRAQIDTIVAGRWFLIRNDGPTLERARCGRCGNLHKYLTLACIERPFHGLDEIYALIEQIEGRDQNAYAIRLGSIEPITRQKAKLLADRIRARGEQLYGPPKGGRHGEVHLPGLRRLEVRRG